MRDDAERESTLQIRPSATSLEARQLLELRRRVREDAYRDTGALETVAR